MPELLRRVAASIEKLGNEVIIEDIHFSSGPTPQERDRLLPRGLICDGGVTALPAITIPPPASSLQLTRWWR